MTPQEQEEKRGEGARTPIEGQQETRAHEMLREFHDTFGGPGTKTDDLWLRGTLHKEESKELIKALQQWAGQTGTRRIRRGDTFPPTQDGIRKAVAQELADVVYVAYGTALIANIDLDAALAEVHRANMSKLGEDGKPILREDGKVLKGPNFTPPDMSCALRDAASARDSSSPASSDTEKRAEGWEDNARRNEALRLQAQDHGDRMDEREYRIRRDTALMYAKAARDRAPEPPPVSRGQEERVEELENELRGFKFVMRTRADYLDELADRAINPPLIYDLRSMAAGIRTCCKPASPTPSASREREGASARAVAGRLGNEAERHNGYWARVPFDTLDELLKSMGLPTTYDRDVTPRDLPRQPAQAEREGTERVCNCPPSPSGDHRSDCLDRRPERVGEDEEGARALGRFVSDITEADWELLRDLSVASPEASIIDLLITEHCELSSHTEAMQEEAERLKSLNSTLTRDFNGMLIKASRAERRQEAMQEALHYAATAPAAANGWSRDRREIIQKSARAALDVLEGKG